MVKTGARANKLQEILTASGKRTSMVPPSPPRASALSGAGNSALAACYAALGGGTGQAQFRPGAWDLAFNDGLIVELDEELHFNRYRANTLDAAWAAALPWTEDYQIYSVQHERDCLAAGRWGKRWSNPSADRLFGPSAPSSDLGGAGSSRWRQRALYDAMKDLFALETQLPLARLSVWDRIGGFTLGSVLRDAGRTHVDEIEGLVLQRTIRPILAEVQKG